MSRKTVLQLGILPLFALLALGSSSPKKDAAEDKPGTTSTTAGSVGVPVVVGDAEWTILDVINRGALMKGNDAFDKDATTTGTFLQLHYRVTNKGKTEGTGGEIPKLIDPAGREFGTYDMASMYRPKDTNGFFLDKFQPSMSKDFYEIYELPAGVTTVSLKAHDFGIFGPAKTISLGSLPAAPAPRPTQAKAPVPPPPTTAAAKAKTTKK